MNYWERKKLEKRIGAMVPRLRVITRSWGCPAHLSDDLTQESVTIALDKLSQLRDPDALEAWVIRIVSNCHRQHYRRNRHLTELAEDELIENMTPDDKLETEQKIARLHQAMNRLDDDQRKIITLVDMEGMSYREVSEILDLRIGTVMSRLHRARNKLREHLSTSIQTRPDDKSTVLWRIK